MVRVLTSSPKTLVKGKKAFCDRIVQFKSTFFVAITRQAKLVSTPAFKAE